MKSQRRKCFLAQKGKGKVTRMAEFGAFVEIVPGVEGLIHTSELENPNIAIDADVEFVILNTDSAERRFELSQKQQLVV